MSILPNGPPGGKPPERCNYTCAGCSGRGGGCRECGDAGWLTDLQVGRGLANMLGRARDPLALAGVLERHAGALENSEALLRRNHFHAHADQLAIEAMTCRVVAARLLEMHRPPPPGPGPLAAAARRLFRWGWRAA